MVPVTEEITKIFAAPYSLLDFISISLQSYIKKKEDFTFMSHILSYYFSFISNWLPKWVELATFETSTSSLPLCLSLIAYIIWSLSFLFPTLHAWPITFLDKPFCSNFLIASSTFFYFLLHIWTIPPSWASLSAIANPIP